MIDLQTGTLVIDDILALGPTLSRSSFLASPLGRSASVFDGAEGWSSFDIGKHTIYDSKCGIVVRFQEEHLRSMTFWIVRTRKSTDDDWSIDAALHSKTEHDQWLARHLGPAPYVYGWGTIESAYDPQSVSSTIVLRYVRA